ncbi:hypothetical protein MKW98_013035 [Papaver atlanticum]|uniref:malate dehydrogenase n=1 Tax=Papaver atlanticum TaxID=357466 RepID=A0AAD4SLZ5_9MAGN|nr:hypothetical protein MKW98_013035 [Papaver atlanticum]
MQPSSDANQRIAAHLRPSNLQMEGSSSLGREDCQAKGGAPGFKVAILGAAGGIGQPLTLLMKMNPLVSVLHLNNVVNAPGVTADVSHMNTGAVVQGFLGQPQLENALTGMDLVIIPAGVPRKPGMARDDLFKMNVAEVLGVDPREVSVPVVGEITEPRKKTLIAWLDGPSTEVKVRQTTKVGAGSATLSMVNVGIVECSFVTSQEIFPLGPLSEYERHDWVGEGAKKELAESIQKGVSFIRN